MVYNRTTKYITAFGTKTKVRNVHEKGLMEIVVCEGSEDRFICKDLEEFVDRTPLDALKENDKEYLFIKHSIPPM